MRLTRRRVAMALAGNPKRTHPTPKYPTDIMKLMTTTALIIALISLGLASVAYWRSGGKKDVQNLHNSLQREMEALRAKQKELVESASQSPAAAFDHSRQRPPGARGNMRQQKEGAPEGLEKKKK